MELSFLNVDQLCSSVNLELEQPVIDLSGITFFRPFALVYLGMFLRYHTSNGKGFHVLLPRDNRARDYLVRQNFWERFNFNPEFIKSENLRRMTTSSSLNDIVDIESRETIAEEIQDKIMEVLRRNRVKVQCDLVAEIILELVDNFARHSQRTLAAVAMQYYPNMGSIVVAVGDCGIGIRESLSSNPQYAYLAELPHRDAALKAFEPLVSCEPGCGTGLTVVQEETVSLKGQLILATGDGYVRIYGDGRTEIGQMTYNLPGVQVQLRIPEGG